MLRLKMQTALNTGGTLPGTFYVDCLQGLKSAMSDFFGSIIFVVSMAQARR